MNLQVCHHHSHHFTWLLFIIVAHPTLKTEIAQGTQIVIIIMTHNHNNRDNTWVELDIHTRRK